jgi:sigma-B regulation protein RsbU (phosphoserine phosphatase)
VVIADVSGHGEPVNAAALRLRYALRQHIDDWDQSLLVQDLNDSFLRNDWGARFATAFFASYASDSGDLLFVNAGHLPPLWYRAAAKEWAFLDDSAPPSQKFEDLPLGLVAGTGYQQTAIELQPGDLLVLYTDGINEAENEAGEQLGLSGLLSIAQGLPTSSAAAAGEELVAAVSRFRGSVPAKDDATVVTLLHESAP